MRGQLALVAAIELFTTIWSGLTIWWWFGARWIRKSPAATGVSGFLWPPALAVFLICDLPLAVPWLLSRSRAPAIIEVISMLGLRALISKLYQRFWSRPNLRSSSLANGGHAVVTVAHLVAIELLAARGGLQAAALRGTAFLWFLAALQTAVAIIMIGLILRRVRPTGTPDGLFAPREFSVFHRDAKAKLQDL